VPEILTSRQCHDTVILCASPTGNYDAGSLKLTLGGKIPVNTLRLTRASGAAPYFYYQPIDMPYVALHQENYATIANYLERELRYMDAGE
jgi:hypothetical protein